MLRFIIRRLSLSVVVLLLVSLLVFFLTSILPGDAARATLGDDATADQLARRRAELGLDRPLPVQYAAWLSNVAQGDFGRSLRTREPVTTVISRRIPVTLELIALAMSFAVAIGVSAGIVSAVRRGGLPDLIATVGGTAGLAIPNFWLALLLVLVFSVWLRWIPPSGYVPFQNDPGRHALLFILPSITLGAALAAGIMRQTRGAMLDVLGQDYIRTARSKGLSPFTITTRHALRNALIPIITIVGLQVGRLVGGAIVIETVFSLPGLGRAVVDGIFTRDYPVVQAVVAVTAVAVLAVNLLVDVLYAWADPRVRFS